MTSVGGFGQRRPRSARGSGAALRDAIVDEAFAVVDETGAAGLTLRGLARRIGISAPAIYAHFADLDAVLIAVAERAFDDLADHLRRATDDSGPGRRLRDVGEAYLAYAQHHPGRYLVMFGGQWDATAAAGRGAVGPDAVAALGHDVLMILADAVGPLPRPPGSASSPSQVDEAVLTWVCLHGYAHQRLVAQAFPWPDGIADQLLDRAAGQRQQ